MTCKQFFVVSRKLYLFSSLCCSCLLVNTVFFSLCHSQRSFLSCCVYFWPRTTDAQWSLFSSKSLTFGLGETVWADKFWGIFGRFISIHFGTVSSLSMFSINQPLVLQKTKPLYPNPKYLFGIGIWIWAAKN